MDFNESIVKHKSVYFHFLDGLLTSKASGTFSDVITTLRELEIQYGEITFLDVKEKIEWSIDALEQYINIIESDNVRTLLRRKINEIYIPSRF